MGRLVPVISPVPVGRGTSARRVPLSAIYFGARSALG